ncbi:MAG: IS110 family transposase [Steroidobacteraceae bacterium]
MTEISRLRIGFDLAKGVFQAHGVRSEPGEPVAVVKRLRRCEVEKFFTRLPPSDIGMEACASAHHWARLAKQHGHDVRLIPPAYVKPYVRRNKTDANDAAAICEAMSRPSMRFVPVKSEADQALIMLHRTRASFVVQRTSLANRIRAAFAEFGIVQPVGERGLNDLLATIAKRAGVFEQLPPALCMVLDELALQWASVDACVRRFDAAIAAGLKTNTRAARLTKVPVIGPAGASAIDAMLPNPDVFKSGLDFAAWIGLTPREDSSGNTIRRGGISKKGDGYLRRLLVLGATARLALIRRGRAKNVSDWERKMAAHPKRKLAAVALANKSARIAWAMLARNEIYRVPDGCLPVAA